MELLETVKDDFIYAQVLNIQGSLQAKIGEFKKVNATGKIAENIYQDLDAVEPLLRTKINQAQAYRSLGYGLRSQKIL